MPRRRGDGVGIQWPLVGRRRGWPSVGPEECGQRSRCRPSHPGMGQELRASLREAVRLRDGAGLSFPRHCLGPKLCPALQCTQPLKVGNLTGDSDKYREDDDRKTGVMVG